MTIEELNDAGPDAFVNAVGFVFEHSAWIARAAWERRPFADADHLHAIMIAILQDAPEERRVALIAAHPDLAGRITRERRLTPASRGEQAFVGLDRLTPEEAARFDSLNQMYSERFGFPFVICARENIKQTILTALQARCENDRQTEIAGAIAEIAKIARLRLFDVVTAP